MKEKISKRGLFAITAKTIDEKKPEVVALMQKHGMNVKTSDDKKRIDMAFLSLLPRSRKFREDFAKLATPIAKKIHHEHSNMSGYHNAVGVPTDIQSKGISLSAPQMSAFPDLSAPSTPLTAPTKTTKAKSTSGFGQWLSDVFDANTTQNIINTGLGIWSYQKTGTTQGTSVLDQGRSDLGSVTPTPTPQEDTTSKSGLTTTGIVLISVAALSLIGFAVYKTMKK